ncbi:MAG: alpha-2-macroglobulin family protein, partial [Planctomycetota bacterium]
WRGESALALVTYEGERIYQAKLLSLQKGSNALPITFDSLLSPNFRLGVAVMDGSKFSSVAKDFKIVRELVVKVKSDRATYAPGEEMEITLETTDAQGHGLSAELSVAVVDESLLTMFPEKLPPITDFFYGQQRSIHVATLSTNTFAYQGQTSQINQSLLQHEQLKALENAPDASKTRSSVGYLRRAKPQSTSGFVADPTAPPEAPLQEMEKKLDYFGDDGEEEEDNNEEFQAEDGFAQKKQETLKKMSRNGHSKMKELAKKPRRDQQGEKEEKDKSDETSGGEKARSRFLSTAYWNPSVVTSEQGSTKIKVRLPSNTTSWRLVIYGIDKDVLVGKAIHTIQVKKDFFVELKPPKTLVENDVPKPLVVVHNYTNKDLLVDVGLDEIQGDQALRSLSRQIQVKNGTVEEIHFPINPAKPDSLTLKAWAKAEGFEDSETKTVVVKPLATAILRGLGGLGTQSLKQTITLPTGKSYFKREFTFQFGPQLASLLFANQFCKVGGGIVSVTNGTIAQAILNYLDSIGTTAGAEYHRYQEELLSVLGELKTTQNTDGGWGFSGVNEQNASWNLQDKRGTRGSDPQVSALAIKVLVGARQKGFKDLDGTIEQGLTYLKNAFTQAQTNSEKVLLLYSMACANDADFAYVNRLYRLRYSLDPYSLAHLSLICSQMGRPEIALELAQILAGQNFYEWNQSKESLSFHPWIRDPIELVGRIAQAFIRAKMPQQEVDKAIQYLITSRGLDFWPSPKGNAAAIEAIAEYLGSYKRSADRYEVQISVNGVALLKETIAGAVPLRAITVPLDVDQADIQIEIQGAGQFTYQAQLTGWVRGMDFEDKDRFIRLEQHYMPEPLIFKGQEIPRGFSVLTGKYEPWVNEVRQLGEGHFTRMVLTPQIKDPNVQEGYLFLEQPIPGGTTILEPTIQGDFENYEMRDGKILFYLGPKSAYGSIQFDLFGFLEGEYQILPPILKSLFEPYRVSTGEAVRLTVIDRNQKSNDPFKMTPDELYHLGKAYFDANEYDNAAPLLKELFETVALQDAYFKETAKMLLYVALEKKNSKDVVRFFEILKERYPQLVIDFGRIIKIGLAYGDLKEFERGLQVFKATVQANFVKEGNISHILEQQGEFLSSVDFMKMLHLHYSDFPVSETAYYSLSQLIYEKSDQLDKDAALKKKISREALIKMSTQILQDFLNLHPDNPLADEASFSLANTYLDIQDYQEVIDLCNRLVKRFELSTYLDDFLYIQGYAYFYLRKYKEAMDLLQRLIQERFWVSIQEQGSSGNRYLARYIMGQIYHARGEAPKAIENYKEIQDRFQDAKEAIEFFEQKELKIKEISTFKVGEPASLTVKHRNIKDLDIKLYKVDLMKLYLLKKNLDQITRIHLAGIEPLWAKILTFTDQYQETETKISLEIKDSGAYLVMLKGDEYDVSGMVLVSDLKIEVQEDSQSGLVRVNVLNLQKNAFESQVHIKVIGSQNDDFVSGETDLRGLFLAENIRGSATVIAQKDSAYAFYRGQQLLQVQTRRESQNEGQKLQQSLQEQNYQNRARSSESLRRLFKNKQQGVQIEQTR